MEEIGQFTQPSKKEIIRARVFWFLSRQAAKRPNIGHSTNEPSIPKGVVRSFRLTQSGERLPLKTFLSSLETAQRQISPKAEIDDCLTPAPPNDSVWTDKG